MFSGLPDLQVTTDVWVVDGDQVATRVTFSGTHQGEWMDVPATGNPVSWTHIDIHRIQDGKITDIWHTIPVGDMLQQIGFELIPSQ
jgi:predicted ester cyclase